MKPIFNHGIPTHGHNGSAHTLWGELCYLQRRLVQAETERDVLQKQLLGTEAERDALEVMLRKVRDMLNTILGEDNETISQIEHQSGKIS